MWENKTVIVTGSTKGIGRGIAEAFAKAGANLVLNGRQSEAPDLLASFAAYKGQVIYVPGNVQHLEDAKRIIKEGMNAFGQIDVLVNNAGITQDTLLLRMKEEQFEQVIDVNLTGSFRMIQQATPILMKQRFGTIINIASVIGEVGNVGQANYAASKAGMIGLTKSVAKELAPRQITCNAIAPGFIETDMTEAMNDRMKETIQDQIPLKRLGSPEDVAKVALFLAEHRYITGQVINVDGGMVMQG